MPRCIVHVGTHKTGTTSIQQSLAYFEDEEFYYARLLGRSNHSIAAYCLFAIDEKRPRRRLIRAAGPNALADMALTAEEHLGRSIDAAGDRTLIISGEGISTISRAGIEKLRARLAPFYDTIHIVAYVRDPVSFMTSAFQQRVRSGSIMGLDSPNLYLSYRQALAKFDDVFGRENVMLYAFERRELLNGDVVADFASRIGIRSHLPQHQNANLSMSRDGVCLLYQYNSFCMRNHITPDPKLLSGLIGKLERPDAPKFRLAPALLQPLLSANQDDIDWISTRMARPVNTEAQDALAGDITGETDLMMPVPGARHKLHAILEQRGLPLPREDAPDGEALQFLAAQSADRNRDMKKRLDRVLRRSKRHN